MKLLWVTYSTYILLQTHIFILNKGSICKICFLQQSFGKKLDSQCSISCPSLHQVFPQLVPSVLVSFTSTSQSPFMDMVSVSKSFYSFLLGQYILSTHYVPLKIWYLHFLEQWKIIDYSLHSTKYFKYSLKNFLWDAGRNFSKSNKDPELWREIWVNRLWQ